MTTSRVGAVGCGDLAIVSTTDDDAFESDPIIGGSCRRRRSTRSIYEYAVSQLEEERRAPWRHVWVRIPRADSGTIVDRPRPGSNSASGEHSTWHFMARGCTWSVHRGVRARRAGRGETKAMMVGGTSEHLRIRGTPLIFGLKIDVPRSYWPGPHYEEVTLAQHLHPSLFVTPRLVWLDRGAVAPDRALDLGFERLARPRSRRHRTAWRRLRWEPSGTGARHCDRPPM